MEGELLSGHGWPQRGGVGDLRTVRDVACRYHGTHRADRSRRPPSDNLSSVAPRYALEKDPAGG